MPIQEREEKPLQTWKVDAARVHSPVYVEHLVDTMVIGVEHPGIYP